MLRAGFRFRRKIRWYDWQLLFKERQLMDSSQTPGHAGTLLDGRFEGRSAFGDLVRSAIEQAAARSWREMIWCDDNFDDWPLGERGVVGALQAWSRDGRKLTMLARKYEGIVRRHARFVTWRQTFSHLVECRVAGGASADSLPSGLWSPDWVFERLDVERCAGFAGSEPIRRVALRERLQERLLKSTPGFAATTLGL
jgi:hypothetical protein